MVRKPLAAVAALALALVAFPSSPAAASAASTARLTAGQTVFPGAGTFSIAVTNNEAAGFLGTGGTAINTVRINFPVNEAGIGVNGTGAAPAGWAAEATDLGTTEYLTYRGSSIAPGATTIFNFPANVLRPKASDLRGDFRVQVSSNGGESFSSAKPGVDQTLISNVKVLQIVSGSVKPLGPVDPATGKGVTDRTGTSGQTVDYGFDIINHATDPISVTPKIKSDDATDTPGTVAARSLPGTGTRTSVTVPLTLGTAPAGGQDLRNLEASATGSTGNGSAATPVPDTFTVQAPVTFSAVDLTPTRTKSGAGSARTFSLRMTKTGVQGTTVDTSTFSFGAGTEKNSKTVGPLAFGAGAVTQTVDYPFLQVLGSGVLDASIVNLGKDDNLAPLSGAAFGAGKITIDNLAPTLTIDALLPTDAQGDQQVASSNDDVITVSGTAQGTDLDASTLKVALKTEKREIPVTVTRTSGTDGLSFRGTIDVGDWQEGETRFDPTASITDTALNTGTQPGIGYAIDVEPPTLRQEAVILSPTEIEVKFLDDSGVRGGCDAGSYSISGRPGAVQSVRSNGSTTCDPRALSDDGIRILVLSERYALGTTDLPTVTYDQTRLLGRLSAKDGAGNDAVTDTIQTVSRLDPLAPVLTTIERRDGGTSSGAFERAYLDETERRYYTNARDEGTAAQPVYGNRVTVSGVRNGYVLQVRATPGGAPLVETSQYNNTSPLAPSEYSGTAFLPIGTTAGEVKRYLTFFVPATGRISPATEVVLQLDRTNPAFEGTQRLTDTTVRTTFTEPVVVGTDAADDWFVTETVATETGTAGRTVNVNSVRAVDSRTREFEVDLLTPSNFRKVDYFFQNVSGRTRYEDRAGNQLASTLTAG